MFYTAAWCISNEASFRKAIPFELLGESIGKYNSKLSFTIVILEGIELLSQKYLNSLQAIGFTVMDYCKEFTLIVQRYPQINVFYNRYERNCLLRWIAFNEICKRDKVSQFWHLDGDVVMHTSLDELANDTANKNFMLQGCPVLVSVSDFNWFSIYERELSLLDNNIHEYSEEASKTREAGKKEDLNLVNDSLYRNPIGSDQDLLEYLISSKKLMQNQKDSVFNSKFYFIQNPLSLVKWHAPQTKASHFEATSSGEIAIGEKKVPFIHYQGTFSDYAEVFIFFAKFRVPQWLSSFFLKFGIENERFRTTIVYRLIFKLKYKEIRVKGRASLINELELSNNNSQSNIVGVLNFILKNQTKS